MTNRLLIVDDDPEITSALARGMALHGYDPVTVNRADHALERLKQEEFCGAIIDVMLGTDSGIDVVSAARAAGVTLPILMLSALSEVEHRTAGLEAGADDYVVKPFDFDELVARLRVQARRVTSQRPTPAQFDRATRVLSHGSASITLTEREGDLLAYLITCGTSPVSRGLLFDTLWSTEGTGSENVVDVYIGYLRKKLKSADFQFEIKTLRNKGFVLDGAIPELN